MKKKIKLFWGCIPLAVLLFCIAVVALIQAVTGDTLRIVPRNILRCVGIGSLGVLLIWGNMKLAAFKKKKDKPVFNAIAIVINVFSVGIFAISLLAGLFVMGYSYQPEHIVTRNNMKMVASVRSFLDEFVYYYQYKNPFFYGKEMGYEYYGSGGGDPLTRTPKPVPIRWTFYDLNGNVIDSGSNEKTAGNNYGYDDIEENQPNNNLQQKTEIKELTIAVMENREDELVFSISLDDYIQSYNGYYWSDKKICYLLPSNEWRSYVYDTAIHSNHETRHYNFTEDANKWPLPTISVYVPTNSDYIQEITLNFDDHSYTESMYALYEEMCFYTLKVFFPGLEDEQITELYTTLNNLAYDNLVPYEQGYSSDSIPCALYYKDGIGLYPYFAVGESMHLCIIPVTENTINDFAAKGVEIHEIK